LQELIETCNAIENRRFNPFLLDVAEALRILRLHMNDWSDLSDHLLDMRALAGLARVVGLQSANLRFQSSTLYVDPSILTDKVKGLTRDQLSSIFLLSWHPIVELEQLTIPTAKEAFDYWNDMLPFSERWRRFQPGPLALPIASDAEELQRLGVLADKAFNKRLDEFWQQLRDRAGTDGRIGYWTFVKGRDRTETVVRAQLTSFLISYGYSTLETHDEQLVLVPKNEPSIRKESTPVSLPIPIPREMS